VGLGTISEMATLGYLISFHTYGTWLHGRAEGSVDDEHAMPGTPYAPPNTLRERRERQALRHPPVELDAQRRFVVDATIQEVCNHRHWRLHALNVRTTHAHIVVSASHTPERVMNDFKAYATRRMREAGVLSQDIEPWSYHGSTRYLNTDNSFARAVQYVLHEQGDQLEMRCPTGWKAQNEQAQSPSNEPRA